MEEWDVYVDIFVVSKNLQEVNGLKNIPGRRDQGLGTSQRSKFSSSFQGPECLACSRLRDGGKKSFSKNKCKKRAGAGERQGGGACTHSFNVLFRYISF